MRRRYTQGSWSIVRERRVRQTAEMMPGIRAPREEVATPVTVPAPRRLCRECDRDADVRNYGDYCSRSCLRQADL